MYRVLIVDDEEPMLDSFSYMLHEYASDFVLAGKARNGYEALSMIYELRPDAVFMDINIPGMDGLQVINEVHERYPAMVFVLSTAYERFDLAQRAIPLGVHAYLVKPISKKTFISTLEEIKNKLEKGKTISMSVDKKMTVENFFIDITTNSLSEQKADDYRNNLSISSDKGCICIIEIEDDNEKIFFEIASRISLKYFCLYIPRHNRGIYFIAGNNDANMLYTYLSEIVKQCSQAKMEYIIGLGQIQTIAELQKSYENAIDNLIKNKSDEEVLLRERIRIVQIRKRIGISDKAELANYFESYWEEVFEYYEFTIAKCKMAGLFNLLIDDLCDYFKTSEPTENIVPLEQEIMNLQSLDESKIWGLGYFDKLQDLFYEKRNKAMPMPLLKALHYIKEHFSETIQLSTVADAVLISPAYLSRLFTEYLSTTFIEYLTDTRISEAQKLMKNTNLSIKEIGAKIGYPDPNYFSKCFKKSTGYTPTEYAEMTRE